MHSLPESPSLVCPVRIYYYDTDAGGVVHNVAYLRLVEEARTKLAEHLGWALNEMAKGEVVPVVVRTEIDYIKPARLADTLLIYAELISISMASFELEFVLRRELDEMLVARCRQKMASVKLATGRPIKTPEIWRMRWPYLMKKDSEQNR